eukprot:1991225-Pyramimonas_sp.AAC.1
MKLVAFPRAAKRPLWKPAAPSNKFPLPLLFSWSFWNFTSNEKQIIDAMQGLQQIISITVIPCVYMRSGA